MSSSKLDNLINLYIKEAQGFYPGLKFSSRYSIYGGEEPSDCELQFALRSKNLIETPYDSFGIKKIIHYTSAIQNVIEIMNSGVLRLSNLSSLNDPQEVSFTNKYLDMNFTDEQVKEYKSFYFSASFCSIASNEYPDEFPMWRLYGNDGYGAAIIFEIENPEADWHNYLLANVQYGDNEAVNNYKDFIKWHISFQKKYNNAISNYPEAITALMALHKNHIWEHEKEVRLLSHRRFDKYTLKEDFPQFATLKHSISRWNVPFSFIELPIYNSSRFKEVENKLIKLDEKSFLYEKNPILKISEIIAGYRINDNLFDNLANLTRYFSKTYNYQINVRKSHLLNFME